VRCIVPPAPLADLQRDQLECWRQRETASRIRIPAMPGSGRGSDTPTMPPSAEEYAA